MSFRLQLSIAVLGLLSACGAGARVVPNEPRVAVRGYEAPLFSVRDADGATLVRFHGPTAALSHFGYAGRDGANYVVATGGGRAWIWETATSALVWSMAP